MFKSKLLLLALISICSGAWAQTVIPIVWPFAAGSMQANYIRAIVEDANSRQNKYQFVFDHRPGAGGTIAMNHALNSQRPVIVSNGTSMFTRPLYYPDSYDVTRFTPILAQMTGQPIAIVSKKYPSMSALRTQSKLSIGIINGSVIQLTAEILAKQLPGIDIVLVPYQTAPDIVRDVIAGNIDVGIEFAADLRSWLGDKRISVIGITGKHSYPGFPTLSSQGYSAFEHIVQNYFFVMSTNTPASLRQELHDILRISNRHDKVLDLYQKDLATPADLDLKQSTQLWQSFYLYWRKIFHN